MKVRLNKQVTSVQTVVAPSKREDSCLAGPFLIAVIVHFGILIGQYLTTFSLRDLLINCSTPPHSG